jgi:hypothetical protein
MKMIRIFKKLRVIKGYAFPYYLLFGYEKSYKLQIKRKFLFISFWKTIKCLPLELFEFDCIKKMQKHKQINYICSLLITYYKTDPYIFFDAGFDSNTFWKLYWSAK